jgi:hypothetical protein
MRIVREDINFERELNPLDSMNIGKYQDLDKKFSELMVSKLIGPITPGYEIWSTYNAVKIELGEIDLKLSKELKYRIMKGEDPNGVCLDLLNRVNFKDKEYYINKIKKWIKKPFNIK